MIALAGCGGGGAPVDEYPDLLIGKWDCTANEAEDGIRIKMTLDSEYRRNGTAKASGTIDLSFGSSNVILNMDSEGPWELDGKTLSEGISAFDIKVASMTGPEANQMGRNGIERMLGEEMQQEIDSGVSEPSTITHLSENKLVMKTVKDNYEVNCTR